MLSGLMARGEREVEAVLRIDPDSGNAPLHEAVRLCRVLEGLSAMIIARCFWHRCRFGHPLKAVQQCSSQNALGTVAGLGIPCTAMRSLQKFVPCTAHAHNEAVAVVGMEE